MAVMKVGAAGIETMSGALKRPKKQDGHNHGNYLVATHRTAATTNPNCQRVYSFDADLYKRSTPVTTEELAKRGRFAAVSAAVAARAKDLNKMGPDKTAFNAQNDQPGGKKTMKKYLWSLELDAWDQAHPQG